MRPLPAATLAATTLAQRAGGPAVVFVTGGRLPTVVLSVERDMSGSEMQNNQPFRAFVRALMSRELGLVGHR